MNVLLILASGKSTRFDGYPKAFCNIGNRRNIENTIHYALPWFDKIFVGVNQNTYQKFGQKVANCEMISIVTGQGDAHSLLKCLNIIACREPSIQKIVVCWGDALFIDSCPFDELLRLADDAQITVACAMDSKPYAWFDTNENMEIIDCFFAKEYGVKDIALHDQSLFLFDLKFAQKYLDEYRKYLGIPYDNNESNMGDQEMKLLYSFKFLQEKGYPLAKCVKISPNKVFSFNTHEELKNILDAISQ